MGNTYEMHFKSLSHGMISSENLSEKNATIIFGKLWNMLADRTERYTMGDSTSIPIEIAEEILKSICYTIAFSLKSISNP